MLHGTEIKTNIEERSSFWQSKKFKIVMILVILWVIVTIYFYRQHCRSIYSFEVNEQVKMDDLTIYIKELQFENFEENYDYYRDNSFSLSELLWQVVVKLELPIKIADPFLGAAYFYSSPYNFYDDKAWTLKVKGFVTAKTTEEITESNDLDRQFDIYLRSDDIFFYPRGSGSSGSTGSNVRFFHKRFESSPLPTAPIKIVIKMKNDDETQEITVHPKWTETKYNFFKKHPSEYYFNPRGKADKFIHDYRLDKEQATEHILPNLRDGFPWENINTSYRFGSSYLYYEGNYKDFSDVYVAHTRYFAENNIEQAVAEQSFYLIIQNGVWYIIDVSPVKKC